MSDEFLRPHDMKIGKGFVPSYRVEEAEPQAAQRAGRRVVAKDPGDPGFQPGEIAIGERPELRPIGMGTRSFASVDKATHRSRNAAVLRQLVDDPLQRAREHTRHVASFIVFPIRSGR